MIAAEQEGLDAYANFVTSIVSSRSKGSLQQQGMRNDLAAISLVRSCIGTALTLILRLHSIIANLLRIPPYTPL